MHVAVVGGGPKAAALAAKARVLRHLERFDARVTIFEPKEIGAYWAGKGGYTDGAQRLCTIAERDVGYPYASMFGREVDVEMAAQYSWGRYLHSRPPGYEQGFSTWVDAGRKPPYHKNFADYLKWVVDRAAPDVVRASVTGLVPDKGVWRVKCTDASGVSSTHPGQFTAAVVTGPGPARRVPIKTQGASVAPAGHIFDGTDFWLRPKEVHALLRQMQKLRTPDDDAPIVIVGAGGTAAAVLSWLVTNGGRDLPIVMVARQASLYTRVDSVFENRLFSDETQWSTLSIDSRRAFFDRLNRGVVWATVMDQVSSASNLTMVDGRAERVDVSSSGSWGLVVRRGDNQTIQLRPSFLVDASGFDPWWFLSLIKGLPASAKRDTALRPNWEQTMEKGLQLHGGPWSNLPHLHAPMLSSHLGPGFGSLMVLGSMADRILKAHE